MGRLLCTQVLTLVSRYVDLKSEDGSLGVSCHAGCYGRLINTVGPCL